MTAPFQTWMLAKGTDLVAYWPLEAGSTADVSGNGNTLTAVGSPGTAGVPLVAGGGPSTTFNGTSQGFNVAHISGWTAQGLQPTTTNNPAGFSLFGWVAPSALALTYLFGKTTYWNFGTKATPGTGTPPTAQLTFNLNGSGISPSEQYAATATSGGAWLSPWPWWVVFSFDQIANEGTVIVNGQFSAMAPLTNINDTGSTHISIGYNPDGTNNWFAGAEGHIGALKRPMSVGEANEGFRLGFVSTPPAWTAVTDLQPDGIPAAGAKILSSAGVFQGSTTAAAPLVSVGGKASYPHGSIVGHCYRCGGRLYANESYELPVVGVGAGLGGVGTRQPIHHSCQKMRPVKTAAYTAGSPPTTYRQFCDAHARRAFDFLLQWSVRGTPVGKPHYLHVNEQQMAVNVFNGVFTGQSLIATGQGTLARYTFQIAHCAAILAAYYKATPDHWTRQLAEVAIDHYIAQWQVPQTPGQSSPTNQLYSQNSIDQAGSNALNWAGMTAIGNQSAGYVQPGDDFFLNQWAQTLWLMAPWMDKAKLKTWKTAFLHAVDFYIGPFSNLTFYINANRNLGALLAMWAASQMTTGVQSAAYREAYALQLSFTTAPPTLPSASLATIQNQYQNLYAYNFAKWGGKQMFSFQTSAPVSGYGWHQVTAPTFSDGSDGSGYLTEWNSGTMAPNGTTVPGFDPDYGQIQLRNLLECWIWNRDPQLLSYINQMVTHDLPLLDQAGGQISFTVPAAGSTGGAAPGPAALITSTITAGTNPLPVTVPALGNGSFTNGQQIQVGYGTANVETLTISSFTSTTITTTVACGNGHAANEQVGEFTSSNPFYTGWNMNAQLGARHHSITQWFNAYPLISWGLGLRQNAPFTLTQVQDQWATLDLFTRTNGFATTSIPNVQLLALLADPAFKLPAAP